MKLEFDPTQSVSAQALQVHAKRLEVLAGNMANADTPNFKARDIDFRAALATSEKRSTPIALAMTSPRHLSGPTVAAQPKLMYRMPLAPSLDGNTVDVQFEQARFVEASVRYRASLTFVGDDFSGLQTALTGR